MKYENRIKASKRKDYEGNLHSGAALALHQNLKNKSNTEKELTALPFHWLTEQWLRGECWHLICGNTQKALWSIWDGYVIIEWLVLLRLVPFFFFFEPY